MIKPLRFLSNGREAFCGLSFMSVQRAFMEAKPATGSGEIQASVPPATITSASPR